MKDVQGVGAPGGALAHKGGKTVISRMVGMVPWIMIGGLLYAGLFIKPKAVGSAVIPPHIEKRDLLLGTAVVGDTVWLDGNLGKILKSSDGGLTWAVQASGTEANLQDMDAWDKDHAVAIGNNATVLITADGGASWKTVPVEHSSVGSKLFRVKVTTSPGEAWMVGEVGAILHTADFGQSWKVMRTPEDVIMSDIDAHNPDSLWIVGEYGRMFHSIDRGASWESLKSPSSSSLTGVDFRDNDHGVAVGLDGVLLVTSDGGKTWIKVADDKNPNRQHLFGVKWDHSRQQWIAVGEKGVWVTIGANFDQFATGKLSPTDLSSHTKLTMLGDKAVIAGSSPGIWDHAQWQSLVGK